MTDQMACRFDRCFVVVADDSVSQHADALAWGALAESSRANRNLGQAASDAARAVRLAESGGDNDVLARALDVLGIIQLAQLDLTAAAATLNREVTVAATAPDPMAPYFAYLNRSDVFLQTAQRCDFQRAFASCYEAFDNASADLQKAVAIVGRETDLALVLVPRDSLGERSVGQERVRGDARTHLDIGDLLFSDYVWHEVLEAERREVVEALLDTSVVRRTNPALATALTGRPDAGELLLEAEARGLFVSRLGPSGWLEVHAVVRDELLAEATRRSPERVAAQHSRAAQWFEDSGEVSSALEHWLLASRPRDALRLLARHVAELYDTGLEATIARTISRIPLNVANADLQAMIELAWCYLLVDKHRFIDTVHQAGASLERFADPGSTPIGRLRMLQAVTATITGDWAEGN